MTSYSVSSVGANYSGCVKLRKIISYFLKHCMAQKRVTHRNLGGS